jgi:nucleoside-diphosphate-sugar epimerase
MRRALEILRGQRVLITGATGFLGSHQVAALRDAAEVHAVARGAFFTEPGVTAHVVDLEDRNAVRSLFARVQPHIVLHLAGFANARQEIENLHPSVTGDLLTTVHVLEACHEAGVRRLVVTGSLEESGEDGPASSPYGVSKLAAAHYAELCHRLYGVPVVTVRIFMAYGPGQREHKFLPQLIEALAAGRPFLVRSSERRVDWIYVDDVTKALALAAASPGLEGCTIDAGTGLLTSIADVAGLTAELMGREKLLRIAPPDRRGERVRAADLEQAIQTLSWRPHVSLRDGLRRTVESYACKEAAL